MANQNGNPATLAQARRRDSLTKRQRVRQTITEMEQCGDLVTFASVAKAARVSTWLVYAEGVRELVHAAIVRQNNSPVQERRAGHTASAASLQTDLGLARDEIAKLRAERDNLRRKLQQQLGQQLEELSTKDLIERVNELTRANQKLADGNHALTAENRRLSQQNNDLDDDLTATRTSLRRMIREQNR